MSYREMPWPHADGVMTYRREAGYAYAFCEVCWWRGKAATLRPARKAAHRHVAATGHTVKVTQSVGYVYGPDKREREHD